MQRPYLHPYAFGVLILLLLRLLLLLFLQYYFCYFITAVIILLLLLINCDKQVYFPGVADLTNQLLRLRNIL